MGARRGAKRSPEAGGVLAHEPADQPSTRCRRLCHTSGRKPGLGSGEADGERV